MKRVLSLVMAMLLLCLSGCGGNEPVSFGNLDPVTTAPETSAETTTSSSEEDTKQAVTTSSKTKNNGTTTTKPTKTTTTTRPTSSDETPPDYSLLPTRQVSNHEWQMVQFHNPSTGIRSRIEIPEDWTLVAKDSRTWTIKRNRKTIGVITASALSDPKDYFSPSVGGNAQSLTDVNWQINWHKENDQDRFYRHFEFNFKPGGSVAFSYRLRVEYTELDDQSAETLAESAWTDMRETFVPLSQTNGSKKILILGNENVASSQIEDFLNDMLITSGSGYTAEAVSREGANVLIFANDLKLSKSIRNGEYAYVFQGAIYSDDGDDTKYSPKKSIADFDAMRSLCEVSQTALVIFPSYNEVEYLGQNIRAAYYDVRLLDWQQEQKRLRDIFYVTYDELYGGGCSTPLTGYIGAHMIYRTLFGKMPPPLTDRSPLSWEEVKNALYEYPEKGSDAFKSDISNIKEYTIQ